MNRERLELSLSKDEGYRTIPYRDTERRWTTGKGINLHEINLAGFSGYDTLGDLMDHITNPAVLEEWFQVRVDTAIVDAKRWLGFLWDDLSAPRQEVIAELSYQLGYTRLQGFKRMRAAIADHDWETAADELLDSRLNEQVPGRTGRHAERFRKG